MDTAKRQPQDDMWQPEDSNLHESVKVEPDQPVKSEYKKTCLDVDCPERKGEECTASVEPVKSVREDELRELVLSKLKQAYYNSETDRVAQKNGVIPGRGHVLPTLNNYADDIMQTFAREAERHADTVIGSDLPPDVVNDNGIGYTRETFETNQLLAAQRNRNHYQGRGE